MIRHIVMWTLKRPEDAPKVKALLDSCKTLVPGIHEFDVGIKTEGLEANCDVVLVSMPPHWPPTSRIPITKVWWLRFEKWRPPATWWTTTAESG